MFSKSVARYELKFPVSYDDMDRLMDDLIPFVRPGEFINKYGIYTVSSLYLDDTGKSVYRRAAEGVDFRQFVRLRAYGKNITPESDVFLELKGVSADGIVTKRRAMMKLKDAMTFIYDCMERGHEAAVDIYGGAEPQILKEIRHVIAAEELKPAVVASCERLPLISLDDEGLRLTFDFSLRTREEELLLEKGDYGEKRLPPKTAVLEIKTAKPLPLWLVKILGKYNYRNYDICKYCLHYKPINITVQNEEGD